MTDPITDMLNRIMNAQAVLKTDVLVPYSELKNSISTILSKEGFVGEVKKIAKGNLKFLKINLKYQDKLPQIEGFRRISKPGQRIYQKQSEIRKVHGGFGLSVVSTSKGLMTNKDARKTKVGGEILFQIW